MTTESFQDFEEMPDVEMDDIEMDMSMDFSDGFQDEQDNRYINPPTRMRTPEHMLMFDRALKLANGLDMGIGSRSHVILSGNFIMGDLIEAIFVTKVIHTKNLSVSTLSMSQNNVDSFKNLFDGGYIDSLDLVLSDYFFSHERNNLVRYALKKLDHNDAFQIGIAGSHTKICLFESDGGKKFVIHGSANLRSSGCTEQISIEENPELYDFHKEYHNKIINEYSVINKSIRREQLWRVIATRERDQEAGKAKRHPQAKETAVTKVRQANKAGNLISKGCKQRTSPAIIHFKTFPE
jgi:hypothetical protein